MLVKAPRGTRDIFKPDSYLWQSIESTIREVSETFGVSEIRTPIFEHSELFLRGVGETTDIVNKEMYTFEDKGNRSLTLRPEGTAGVVRAFIEHKLYSDIQPTKLYYINNTFRYERPQAGRMREFTQYGVEVFGSGTPICDAEVISLAYEVLQKLGLKNIELKINSLGNSESRKVYNESLKKHLNENIDTLCTSCQKRYDKNPLRVLDCKEDSCKEVIDKAPSILDFLTDECKNHFSSVQNILNNIDIPFTIDPKIVRGLDYYTRTVFEFVSKDIGAQGTVCGGGRYDNLVENFGGPKVGAVGFAMGIERLILAIISEKGEYKYTPKKDIFIGYIGEKGLLRSQKLVFDLRKKGILAEGDTLGRSVKSQLKYADKIGAIYSVILGDEEVETNTASIKDMQEGTVMKMSLDEISKNLFLK